LMELYSEPQNKSITMRFELIGLMTLNSCKLIM
jgi:hypothetical protein